MRLVRRGASRGVLFGVRAKRVSFVAVAVADRSLLRNCRALRTQLRRAALIHKRRR